MPNAYFRCCRSRHRAKRWPDGSIVPETPNAAPAQAYENPVCSFKAALASLGCIVVTAQPTVIAVRSISTTRALSSCTSIITSTIIYEVAAVLASSGPILTIWSWSTVVALRAIVAVLPHTSPWTSIHADASFVRRYRAIFALSSCALCAGIAAEPARRQG
mmetsp:Transcript_15496/g.28748  ORF Transcript_15496/g.28748 Transcript_15496/m.28748 type:complete len:161 (-) Transcript_15496:389-871(-)